MGERGEFNLKENEEKCTEENEEEKKDEIFGLNIPGIIFNDEMDSAGIKCRGKSKKKFFSQ